VPLVLIDTDYEPFTVRPRPEGRVIFLRPAQEHDYLASLITELRGQGVDFDAHRYDEAVPEKEPPGAVIVDPLLDPIAEAFAGDAHVTPMNATSLCVDRKVFVMLAKGALVVKLPTARVATLISSGVGQPWDPGNGKPMKQWLLVPMASGADWIDLARESRAFTGPG
jgi:hypothetical protein